DDIERFKTFQQVTDFTRFAAESGLIGEVIASGEPVQVLDVGQDRNCPNAGLAKELGIRTGLAFPVLIGTEVAGVMEFYSTDLIEPDEQLLKVMLQIGVQLGRVVERSRAVEALRKSEVQFRAIFDRAAIGISLVDMEGRLIESNSRLQEMLGYREEELRGMVFTDFTHPDDAMADWN